MPKIKIKRSLLIGCNTHLGFADDTQLYGSFKPDGQVSQDAAVGTMERYTADLPRWMIHDRLLLDDDKTEVLSWNSVSAK